METLPIFQTTRRMPFYPDLAPADQCCGAVQCQGDSQVLPAGTVVAISQQGVSTDRVLLYALATEAHDAGWAWANQSDFA